MSEAREIAERLSERGVGAYFEHWRRTVLLAVATGPQRKAFADGYNGVAMIGRYSPQMKDAHTLGVTVRAILETPDD